MSNPKKPEDIYERLALTIITCDITRPRDKKHRTAVILSLSRKR
jgi:hypothetical protein